MHTTCTQVSPDGFVLVAGALTEVLLSFKPVTAGPKDIKVGVCVRVGACVGVGVGVCVWVCGCGCDYGCGGMGLVLRVGCINLCGSERDCGCMWVGGSLGLECECGGGWVFVKAWCKVPGIGLQHWPATLIIIGLHYWPATDQHWPATLNCNRSSL